MTTNRTRPSRIVREGSVGLLALVAVVFFGVTILWLRGFTFGDRNYRVLIDFLNVSGLQVGSPTLFRGVTIGRVTAVRPEPNGVEVEITINSSTLVIPRDVRIEANQSGLISETVIEFTPLKPLPDSEIATANPLAKDCNPDLIICNGAQLKGEIGVSFDELLRSSIRFSEAFSDSAFLENLNQTVKNTSDAAHGITTLTRSLQGQITTLSASVKAVGKAANQINLTATQVNSLVADNRATLVKTLNNLSATSSELRGTVAQLSPFLNRVEKGKLLANLETFAANAAQISVSLKEVTSVASNPGTLIALYQLLDSARATFQNTQKITASLESVTSDPAFRQNLRKLLDKLNKLMSSTVELERQTQLAQVLAPLALPATPPHPPRLLYQPIPPPRPLLSPQQLPAQGQR
ncbi:MlaD family protein [Neosynechococcus sphagnicola]|uniref:MlaD family protein n=1 Tax=Neosynechococcus sphagnicola TaxID=1501145 RepID=UPI00068EAEEE|nr:MlaD family protein [Neosynechococcus sphagnicola]